MRRPHAVTIKVEVTEKHIADAIPRDSNHCMIADAIKSAMPTAANVSVDLATIRLTDPARNMRYTYLTPRVCQAALVNFDQERKPEPFGFRLRNGQVTQAHRRDVPKKPLSDKQKAALEKARTASPLNKTHLVHKKGDKKSVPDRIGGKTPPLQRSKDNVPFSRRRAFGLRALEL